ncbi:MAG TPA: 4Fe-4S dicluster domain-containing protein [Thermoplasmata archaeon]|jgi:heterodisulfide reductase subunit C|nr:4Fe-4S dicluster domain-containing protein [Thermoplasmata archaeon]
MPIAERSLVEVDRLEHLELDGVDVSGDWNTFLKPRVVTDIDSRIVEWVKRQPFGETISQCWQCGTCTASCCMHTDYGMPEFNPRRFIYLAQVGDEKELRLHAEEIWRCISCNKCVERCPKGVKVEEVVHAIGSYLRATGQAPESPADRFDRAFTDNLLRRGVLDEAALFRAYERGEGRTTPFRDLLRTGLRLFTSGRLRTGPLANRTRGWRRMRSVLRAKLDADEAGSTPALPSKTPNTGGTR